MPVRTNPSVRAHACIMRCGSITLKRAVGPFGAASPHAHRSWAVCRVTRPAPAIVPFLGLAHLTLDAGDPDPEKERAAPRPFEHAPLDGVHHLLREVFGVSFRR